MRVKRSCIGQDKVMRAGFQGAYINVLLGQFVVQVFYSKFGMWWGSECVSQQIKRYKADNTDLLRS